MASAASGDDRAGAPSDARQDQLRILSDHMGKLKDETAGWLDRQARVWQTAIAGAAAIVVFRENTRIELFLPLAPILALAVVAQWLRLHIMVIRAGYAMAVDEVRINDVVGQTILTHEVDLWESRSKWLRWTRRWWIVPAASVLVSAIAYAGLVRATMQGVRPDPAKLVYAVAAGLVLLFIVGNLGELYRLGGRRHPLKRARSV